LRNYHGDLAKPQGRARSDPDLTDFAVGLERDGRYFSNLHAIRRNNRPANQLKRVPIF